MSELTSKMNRRDFFKAVVRRGLMGAMVMLGWMLLRKPAAGCERAAQLKERACRGCAAFERCDLPEKINPVKS
jgi:hypothetical protein